MKATLTIEGQEPQEIEILDKGCSWLDAKTYSNYIYYDLAPPPKGIDQEFMEKLPPVAAGTSALDMFLIFSRIVDRRLQAIERRLAKEGK